MALPPKTRSIAYSSILIREAIAQILSDMDAEIEAVEQKCDKCKAIKQGMIQKLLEQEILCSP
jgi:type I restriction enzyme, S subunit